jgi:hypothetical protein
MMNSVDVRIIFGIIALVPCAYSAWQAIHEGNHEKQKTWIINVLLWVAIAAWCNFFEMGLAIISMTISMGIYLKQDKQTQEFNGFQEKALKDLRKGSQAAFDALVAMRNDDLQRRYEDADRIARFTNLDPKNKHDAERDELYWKHKWVFESFEHVTLTTDTDLKFSVKVLGTTLDFRKEKLITTDENLYEQTHYICQVENIGQTKPNAYEQQDNNLLDYFWDREEWKGRQSPLSEPLWTGRTIAVAFIFGKAKLYVFSSINKGEITPRAPRTEEGIPIKSFLGGKSHGGNPPSYILDKMEKNVHYFNRIVDHKVSTSQGDGA